MFKDVWKGWTVGVTIIFMPLMALVGLLSPEPPPQVWVAVISTPIIAALQGILIAALVVVGLKVASFKKVVIKG
ncbi:hypothetical protein MIB92_05600 [Aestuariirhabdus sp. Z084]|uniref:hypothetical protein n=1 Tax=Aestuariirhabdus haliotis TaxID=2918751 RepID=UPI00201B3905|nr:hypothetical protein [Aestuariirhabdus haliotis]MCL6415117.1 hypothetical protein [Aestuariirhabdus haliotis]MCL6419049.1 hypothetical protein [Aestuariirhabdus haliotis]